MSDACVPFRELVSAQLDGDLTPGEEASLLDHLAGCSACQVYRRRLKKTVAAVREVDATQIEVPDSIFAALDARLGLSDAVDLVACARPRELLSADLDQDLSSDEQVELGEHLAGCEPCQAHRERLARSVAAVRGSGATLVDVPESVYAELDARLAGSGAQTLTLAPAVTELKLAPAPGPLASVDPDEPLPVASRAKAGRVIPWEPITRYAAAAAVLAVAAALAYDRLPVIQSAMDKFLPKRTTPEARDEVPVPRGGDPEAPVPNVEATQTPDVETPPPTNEDLLPPDPVDEPPPTDEPQPKTPEPLDLPPANGADDPATQERRPERVEIQLAELRDLIQRIRAKRLAAGERAALVSELGEPRFNHPEAYAFLASVLKGGLDGFDDPAASRRAAFGALGSLGTVEAVAVLLDAPLRRAHVNEDGADLVAALLQLSDGGAIRALASVFEGRKAPDPERTLLIVEALDALARPESVSGLLALFSNGGAPAALRREAAVALGHVGDDRAFGPIRDGLTERKAKVRQGSALALGSLAAVLEDDAPACVLALTGALDDRDPSVALAAIEGLALSRRREAIEPLIACLSRKSQVLVRAAERSLRALAGPMPEGRPRTPAGWRALWEKRPQAVLAPVPAETLDLKSFRDAPSESSGVVFVIDTSGSMAPKWDMVCFELRKALERCDASTRFQVLFFSDAPRALWPNGQLAPATQAAKARALEAAQSQSVVSSGQTAIGLALTQALEHTRAETIYLISDGLESRVTFSGLQRAVRRQNVRRAQPARIHTVHVRFGGDPVILRPLDPQGGEPEDVTFMRRLAWENGGVYAHN